MHLHRNVFRKCYLANDLFVLADQTGRLAEVLEASQVVGVSLIILTFNFSPYFDWFTEMHNLKSTVREFQQIQTNALSIVSKGSQRKENYTDNRLFYQSGTPILLD